VALDPSGTAEDPDDRATVGDDSVDEVARLSAQLAAARRSVAERDDRIQELTDHLDEVTSLYGSSTLAAAGAARRLVKRLLPVGTRRTRAVAVVLGAASSVRRRGPAQPTAQPAKSEATRYAASPAELAAEYRRWRRQNEPGPDQLGVLRRANLAWEQRPLVTVVVPVLDADPEWLDESIDSVEAQVYGQWELCVAVDPSLGPDVADVVERHAAADTRIRLVSGRQDIGTALAQQAAEEALGEWVVRLDAGDLLRPDALHRLVEHIASHGGDDVVYADEDRLSPTGDRERPELKPDWSPDYLLSKDYVGSPTAVRRSLLEDVGGWRPGNVAAEDHDLHLRATERARGVGHVARVLSSRRKRPPRAGAVPPTLEHAVNDALRRRRLNGRAVARTDIGSDTCYDVRYQVEGHPLVDIVIPTRDRVDLLDACITSIIERSTYPTYRITVVDNNSVEDATLRYLERKDLNLHVVHAPGPFNFSRIVNTGVRASEADYVLLLNNDVLVLTDDWIEALLELGQQSDVGAVGCRLLFPDGSVQHEGIALLPEYVAANASWPYRVIRNTSAVTAACMLVRRDLYWSIGGFDEEMGVVYNDVDFCLRMGRSGQRVLYTPYAQLEHDESSSRGRFNPTDDIDLFFTRWGTPDQLHDPYVSPHVIWPHPQRLRMSNIASGVGP
jgi:GT2 family glycosyltransferase